MKISFIGCGKMAGAIIKGIVGSGIVSEDNILATKSNLNNIDAISEALGVKIVVDNKCHTTIPFHLRSIA